MPPSHKSMQRMLVDPDVPIAVRRQLIRQASNDDSPMGELLVDHLLMAATGASTEQTYRERKQAVTDMLRALEEGPLRYATFDCMQGETGGVLRARVLLPEGVLTSTVVADPALIEKARCGDTVWLDSQGKSLVYLEAGETRVGEEAQIERWLPGGEVEVSLGELGRMVCRVGGELLDQAASGDAPPGTTVIVCPRRLIAFSALPPENGHEHLRFLCHDPVPDVVVERDIGAPPAFIEECTRHLRRELLDPEVGRRYGLRRSQLVLLSGIPGSGKSLGIKGFWNRMMATTAEIIGVSVDDLPARAMRLEPSSVLDKWVGSSDRAIARFFQEVEQVAEETFEGPDGRVWELPLLVICEEIDALARQRGDDPIFDRIQTNLLTGLDPSRAVFSNRLVFVMCTTNTPQLVDTAFIRRAGGTIAHFGRLGRRDFRAVLEKHLMPRPFDAAHAPSEHEARKRSIADLSAWLFGPNAPEEGQVEVTFTGQANGVVKHRRDFLTAGLIDRAVQQASRASCDDEWEGAGESGLTHAGLQAAIDSQVRNIVDLLTPANCGEYLELPDGVNVQTVRRLERPAVLPFQLERAS